MYQLGRTWLTTYYRILIKARATVILCAELEGNLVGFTSGSIDAEYSAKVLAANRIRLLVAAIPALIRNPALVPKIRSRQQARSAEEGQGYLVQSGAREEFWAWVAPQQPGALELHLSWLTVMKALGVKEIKGEVDAINATVLKTHQLLGARVIRDLQTPDGRKRFIIRYSL